MACMLCNTCDVHINHMCVIVGSSFVCLMLLPVKWTHCIHSSFLSSGWILITATFLEDPHFNEQNLVRFTAAPIAAADHALEKET